MRKFILASLFMISAIYLAAQQIPARPAEIIKGTYHGISKPLRDLPQMTAEEFRQLEIKGQKRTLNKGLKDRSYPFEATALPRGVDTYRQDFMGKNYSNRSPLVNFDGQTSPYYPPDCNGTAGPNHYMQTINCVYAIYSKTGTLMAGPTNLNLLFGNVPGANRNDGDPIILYDEQADRWFVTEFSIPFSGPNYILLAVSTTNDPTGTWHQYSFQVSSLPDYPKFSVWQDGYYMADNNTSGNDIYVFEREKILIGAPAQAVGFNNPWRPSSSDGFMCVPPIDNDGAFAPAGMPGMFIAFNDDALGGGADELWLYELDVDWTTPVNSTFQRVQQLPVQPFNANFGQTWDNIEQKSVSQRLDAIPQVIMNVPQYRNFGTHQTIVCCHTINMNGVRHAGIRWYELRKTTGNWEVRQQGTYAPDANSRWMGSICMNGSQEIGLGYSVSSTSIYPGILFCGQSAGENALATGILDIMEDTIQVGTNSQTGANRWGDYAQLCVDPSDDKTFWFTTQYVGSGGSRKTKIASFRYDFAPVVATLPATQVTASGATLNGTVNPNGLETTYHFEYGLTPVTLNNATPSIAIGSGTASINVSANVMGLNPGTAYYYKVVAESSGGTVSGMKIKFTTGLAPFMNVTPSNQNVASSAGETEFSVHSNVDWTVSSDAGWCTATASGTDTATIFVTFQENPVAAQRIATLTISGTGVGQQTVTVTQDGALPMLSVTPPVQNVAAAGGEKLFDVISNTSWSVVSNAPWCSVNSAGSMNGTISSVSQENTSVMPRTAQITITGAGVADVTVHVEQAGAAPMLAITPPVQQVAAAAGIATFSVTSNTSWTVHSDAAWCTVNQSGSGNGSILALYTQNDGDQPRTANISVSVTGLPVSTVQVTQAIFGIGIGETSMDEFRVFPNPVREHIRIIVPTGFKGAFHVAIQDITGKTIMGKDCHSDAINEFDLSGLAGGSYQVVIKSSDISVVRKIVVL